MIEHLASCPGARACVCLPPPVQRWAWGRIAILVLGVAAVAVWAWR